MLGILRALVNIVMTIIEFLLLVRFFLRFFGASPEAPFVTWIYETTAPLIAPFINIFPTSRLDRFVIDFTTLFALIVYILIGTLLLELVSYISFRRY